MDKFKKLIELEEQLDLSRFYINDIWIYPVIKQNIFVYELSDIKDSIGTAHAQNIISKGFQSLKWFFKINHDSELDIIMFDSADSRRKNSKGIYSSIYTDVIWELFPEKKLLTYERPGSTVNHFNDIPDIKIYYPDFNILKFALQSYLKTTNNLDENKELQKLLNLLSIDASIIPFIEKKIHRFFLFREYFIRFLKKKKPKCVLIVCGYTYYAMALSSACKRLGIPTAELQHGFIRENHPGYIYKNIIDRELFPDYFLSFGEYFSNYLQEESILFDEESIINCGFPTLGKYKNSPVNLDKELLKNQPGKKILLVTSQWSIREKLKPYIAKVLNMLPDDYLVVYKTHPAEVNTADYYKELTNQPNFILIDNPKISSLDLMKVSDVHSTVYSTSFMEALYFDLPNIFINVDEYSYTIKKFVDDESCYFSPNPESFVKTLQSIDQNISSIKSRIKTVSNKFYKSDPESNLKSAIEFLIERC